MRRTYTLTRVLRHLQVPLVLIISVLAYMPVRAPDLNAPNPITKLVLVKAIRSRNNFLGLPGMGFSLSGPFVFEKLGAASAR